MLYGMGYWVIKMQHVHKVSLAEMRMLRWINDNMRKDMVWKKKICLKIGVSPIDEKRRVSRLSWLVMCKGEQLMLQWGRVIWFKLWEQKEVEKDLKVEVVKKDILIKEVKEYTFGLDKKVENNTCGRPGLVYWESITNTKILGLKLCYRRSSPTICATHN